MNDPNEEDDFMSDRFLNTVELQQTETYSQKRLRAQRLAQERDEKNRVKPRHQLEQEYRDQALNQALDASNKGFQLFQRLATKSASKPVEREPIPIHLKRDRRGLGHTEDTDTKIKDELQPSNASQPDQDEDEIREYQMRQRRRFREKQVHIDLAKSRLACQQLDAVKGVDRHELWLPDQMKSDKPPLALHEEPDSNSKTVLEVEAENEDVQEDTEGERQFSFEDQEEADKLVIVTAYLRSTHWYCHWCGVQYGNANALNMGCPGPSREAHDEE